MRREDEFTKMAPQYIIIIFFFMWFLAIACYQLNLCTFWLILVITPFIVLGGWIVIDLLVKLLEFLATTPLFVTFFGEKKEINHKSLKSYAFLPSFLLLVVLLCLRNP